MNKQNFIAFPHEENLHCRDDQDRKRSWSHEFGACADVKTDKELFVYLPCKSIDIQTTRKRTPDQCIFTQGTVTALNVNNNTYEQFLRIENLLES